jgi:hypothetical protein
VFFRRQKDVYNCAEPVMIAMVRRTNRSQGESDMRKLAVAALSAAVIACVSASSAQAAMIYFVVAALDGSITYTGASLDVSSALDIDSATLLVMEAGKDGDASGLVPFDTVAIFAPSPPNTNIEYGSGDKPSDFPTPLGASVVLSWTGSGGDEFTETLTTVDSIVRGPANAISVELSGKVSDADGVFKGARAVLMVQASQDFGLVFPPDVTFTNAAGVSSIPEPSTWALMALGFGVLGYATVRRRKTNISMLSA